jgi:hypothetical protein
LAAHAAQQRYCSSLPALKHVEQYGHLNAGEFKKDLDQIASSATTAFRLLGRTKKAGQAFTPEWAAVVSRYLITQPSCLPLRDVICR